MNKPEGIPQDVWDKALEAMHPEVRRHYAISPMAMVQHLSIAKAILSAVEEEREACAVEAEKRSPDDDNLDWQVRQQVATAIRNRKGA